MSEAFLQQLASAIKMVVQIARLQDGSRKIISIAEVLGVKEDRIDVQDVFFFERTGVTDAGKVQGRFRGCGVTPRIMERLTNTNILFLDACRDNPLARNLARSMGTRSSEIARGLAQVEAGIGTLISFSTQPGNVALDGTGRNSPFAGALVKHMDSLHDDLSAILIAVRNDVMKETQRRQVPWEHSALTGRFFFDPATQGT